MIPLFKVHMPASVMEPLEQVLMSGYIGQGPKVDRFERELAPWTGTNRVLAVNSGTSAINLALRLAGVGPGSDVVSTPMTCSASNSPILERGADIVWADIDPWTGNIDPEDAARKITRRTKAVLCVDWGGYPCDLEPLLKVCRERGILLIEDSAHAFGALYRGLPVGCVSDYTCFSLQAIKHLTTGDGGILTCIRDEDHRRGKLLRWFGIDRETPRADLRCENDIPEWGFKHHMNDIAATIGLENLGHVPRILARHRENAEFYRSSLRGLKRTSLLRYAVDRTSSYWIFTVRVENRPAFQDFMAANGVQVSRVHVRNDIHTAFKAYRADLPGVDEFSDRQVSIPCGWWVSDEDRGKVAKLVREWDRVG